MKLGANVPPGVLLRIGECERCESLLINPAIPKSASDWLREWDKPFVSGDWIMLDLDLACPGGGPGDGVASPLPNGLLRHRGPF